MNRIRYFWRWDTPKKYAINLRAYFRMISGIDNVMNRVIQHLDKVGVADNTIIIFCGDNGYYEGQRGFAGKWSHYEEHASCAADYLRSTRRKKTAWQGGRPNGAQHRHRNDHS